MIRGLKKKVEERERNRSDPLPDGAHISSPASNIELQLTSFFQITASSFSFLIYPASFSTTSLAVRSLCGQERSYYPSGELLDELRGSL